MGHIEKKKNILKSALAVLFLTGMVFVSETTQQPAILFPEILALLTGMWVTPRMPWRVRRWQIPLLMTISAVWGVVLSRWLPAPTAVKMGVAFLGAAVVLLTAHATLLPILSACILPILIGEQSWVYPVAVCVMTVLLAAGQALLDQFKLRQAQPETTWSWNSREELIRWGALIPITTCIAAAAVALGYPCVVAPPLVVLLSELSFPESPVAAKEKQIALVTILCACIGAAARYGLCMTLAFPLWVAALIAAAGALGTFALLKLPFPPAGALAILPLLLPETLILTYPLQVAAGTLVFLLSARIVRVTLRPSVKAHATE